MLSIFATLKETLFLWVRNLWYFAILTLITEPFDIFLRQLHFDCGVSISDGSGFLGFIVSTAIMGLDIVELAALLGLLQKELTESMWMAVFRGIRSYTFPLIRLTLLIAVICIAYCIGVAIMAHFQILFRIKSLLELGLYVVFMVCALSVPVLAIEKKGAFEALKRGWAMTGKRLLYVLGCFLVPGGVEWLISWALDIPLGAADGPMTWVGTPLKVALDIGSSAWIVLLWCMCLRIKSTEAQPLSSPAVNLSPPESPSAL